MQEIISYFKSCITSATCDDSTIKITKDQMDKILLKHQLHCALKSANDHPITIAISHQFNITTKQMYSEATVCFKPSSNTKSYLH